MHLIKRNDTSLAIALVAATIILFQQPLRSLLDFARDIEGQYHVDLIPALMLLLVVFTLHENRKRAQAKADAQTSAAEATQTRARNEELEQLMAFGEALANAHDRTTLQQVVWRHLPSFARGREFWVLTRKGDRWELLAQDGASPRSVETLEQIARHALEPQAVAAHAGGGSDELRIPLIAGGAPVGVAGFRGAALSTQDRNALGAAAALMAIAVRNVQLFLDTRELSLRDGLTNCFNRAHAITTLDSELRRARRAGRPLSILMFDIDHFKSINDELGHLRGDELLKLVSTHLSQVVRSTDVRCRYGGDEFLVILPDTPAIGAEQVAEVIRREISALRIAAGSQSRSTSISIGVASAQPSDRTPEALIERADAALYDAKRSGRNRVSVAPIPRGGLLPIGEVRLGERVARGHLPAPAAASCTS